MPNDPWYQQPVGVVLATVLCFPVGLVLLWTTKRLPLQTKAIVTGAVALMALVGIVAASMNEASRSRVSAPTATAPAAAVPTVPTTPPTGKGTAPRSTAAPGPGAAGPLPDGVFLTKANYVGADTQAKLDKAVSLVAAGDRDAFAKYVNGTPGVFLIPAGMRVSIVDTDILGGNVKVRRFGTLSEFWTQLEAVDRP
jgi:hypothetical protein